MGNAIIDKLYQIALREGNIVEKFAYKIKHTIVEF